MSSDQDKIIIEIKKLTDQYEKLIENKDYVNAKEILKRIVKLQYQLAKITHSASLQEKRFQEGERLMHLYENFDKKYNMNEDKKVVNYNENNNSGSSDGDSNEKQILRQVEHADVTFDSIFGLEKAKASIKSALTRIEFDNIYSEINDNPNFGLLLYGEPGTGKTMFAKAVATELNVPFFEFNVESLKDKYVGESEKNVVAAFNQVRKYKIVVLYCDEAEALFGIRSNDENSKLDSSMLNIILREIDGFQKSNNHIILIASTNYPEKIDPAALSRFPNKVRVGLPDREARLMMIKKKIKKLGDDITYEEIADMTDRYSGRNIRDLITNVFDYAFDDYRKDHPVENTKEFASKIPVLRKHVLSGLKMIGPDTSLERTRFYDRYEEKFANNTVTDSSGKEDNQKDYGDFNVKLKKKYVKLDLNVLGDEKYSYDQKKYEEFVKATPKIILNTLENFKVSINYVDYVMSKAFTRFEFQTKPGVSAITIIKYKVDLERELGGKKIRILPSIPNKPYFGIEVENPEVIVLPLKDFWRDCDKLEKDGKILFPIGHCADGVISLSADDCVHTLIAGACGTGKSIFLHSLVSRLISRYSPEELRLVLIDPKQVEFVGYDGVPHVYGEIGDDPEKAMNLLLKLVAEMNKRYALLKQAKCKNIQEYNENSKDDQLPYIITFTDEYADLVY